MSGAIAAGLLVGTGVIVLGSGWTDRVVPSASATATARFDRTAFHQALDAVLDRYVEPVDEAELLARGLEHMVAGLDAHSHFLTAVERKALRDKAKGGTAGLAVLLQAPPGGDEHVLEVVGVLPGSPAADVGLAPGDHILEVGGRPVAHMLSQIEAESVLMGEVGSDVSLRVQRAHDPAPRRISLTLAASEAEHVTGRLVSVTDATGGEARVAVISIRVFRAGVGEAVKKRIARLRRSAGSHGLAAIVLDLRGNPGGEVDQALVVADLFVGDGILTRTRGRGGRILREELAHEAGTDEDTPLLVVQDRHTASAAELLTAALVDHGRAKNVGERSYGKGTVQEIMGLADGSVLKLTIARYFSPKDRKIDGEGVEPAVALTDLRGDAPIDAALRQLGLTRASE